MSDLTEKLSPDQAQLLAHVNLTEQTIGGGQIPHDAEGNPIEPDAVAPENPAAENQAILATLIAMLTPVMPFLPQCYTPEIIERIANAYTAVEEKHGWNARQYLSVEVQLGIVAIPPSIMAYAMGKEYFAELKRQREVVINPDGADGGGDGSS